MTRIAGKKDQAERLRQLVANERNSPGFIRRNARVITVASGKGGVGKTNFTVNLGIAIAKTGLQVGIIDADLGLANIDIVLGLIPKYNLLHVLNGEKNLAEVVIMGPEGLQIIPGGSGVMELADASPWQVERFIRGFQELDENLDLLLIDTGAGINKHVLTFLKASEETIVITTPEPTAVTDAYGLIKMLALSDPNAEIFVVVNMADSLGEGEQVFERLNVACTRFLGISPNLLGVILRDNLVTQAVREQVPFIISHPHGKASRCVAEIAGKLSSIPVGDSSGGLRAMFKKVVSSMIGA